MVVTDPAERERRSQAVFVSLSELKDGSIPLQTLEDAFGPESLGIIIVRDLPERFQQLRRQLLSLSSYLANLPPEELGRCNIPATIAETFVDLAC